jgi:hypothetical protein
MHALKILLLQCLTVWTLVEVSRAQRPTCNSICSPLCFGVKAESCKAACLRICSGIPHSTDSKDVYFTTRLAFELPAEEIITSGDAPPNPPNDDFYFTTLNGKLYHYVTSESNGTAAMQLTQLYRIGTSKLDQSNGKGLFSVAVDRDYLRNRKMYLAYAMKLTPTEERRRYIPGSQKDPNLLSMMMLDHYTTIQEITLNGPRVEPGPVLRQLEQYTSDNVGNWMGALHADPALHGPENRLIIATGGNAREDGLLAAYGQHLSTLKVLVPKENGNHRDELWASAIRRPVECSATATRARGIRCLLETEDIKGNANGTVLYELKRGTNYGSEAFRQHCEKNSLGCTQRINDLSSRDGLIRFSSDECPVRSLHVYTGSRTRMPNFYGKTLGVRESCYNGKDNEFTEVELLYMAYNSAYGRWRATPLKIYLEHRYMINVSLLGADNQNTLMIGGYSLTSGTVVVQEMIPMKAGQFIDIDT